MPALTPEQLSRLPENPYRAVVVICDKFEEMDAAIDEDTPVEPRDFIEYFILLKIYTKKAGIRFSALDVDIRPDTSAYGLVRLAVKEIKEAAELIVQKDAVADLEEYYGSQLNVGINFEISDGDIEVINKKLLELRNLISVSVEVEPAHKERILKRLEALQGEIHRKNSNFDKLTGSLLEVIMLAQKAGEAAQVWKDIAKDIFAIIWVAQGHIYQLASGVSATLLH